MRFTLFTKPLCPGLTRVVDFGRRMVIRNHELSVFHPPPAFLLDRLDMRMTTHAISSSSLPKTMLLRGGVQYLRFHLMDKK
mmetsp:Transcript_14862/g.25206  ORF Transcript_14862/g.25206 Transcript_14862/m.25206 type:complete len:81 (+) Transcript_14862:1-243(+)